MLKKTKITYLILGMGIGIIITSTLYSLYPQISYIELEDEIIIERARELGMVNLKESIKTENFEAAIDKEETLDQTGSEANLEEETELEEKTEEIEITIESGLTLTNVATKLYDAGLIEDKDDFISFVKNKKLQGKIISAKYKITSNSSYDEIVEMLTFRP
ncbi:hypothetical protein [Tissierella sp.]|uniref:hypothetical protein n=1 Tax=Tissierella sp. TaxID=41274 RepID=UPI0028583916|nr:hypothetical protein [Tissierella sp.]MDR7856442.1 hypothetical protein [Tissierella sp.]